MARILLIDDEPKIRIITRMMLEKAGHSVVEASSGEEGLRMMEDDRPDLILLDVMMPGMDGWEVCKMIKADEKLTDIPLAMFTIRTSPESMKKGIECGADAHINKPFDMEELLDTVEKLVGKVTK